MADTTTVTETTMPYQTNYGGFIDAIGGIATIVLAIFGLAGVQSDLMISIITIIFGAALLIYGGTMLSEYAQAIFPAGATTATGHEFSGAGSLSAVFLVGVAGVILGILALVGIYTQQLTSIAVIAFGAALVLSSSAIWNLQLIKRSMTVVREPQVGRTGGMVLAGEMASGSASMQAVAGAAAVVLGILAVIGLRPEILTFCALLVLGTTIILTGTALSNAVLSFMRPAARTTMSRSPTTTYGA